METAENVDPFEEDVDLLLSSVCVDIDRDDPELAQVAEELYQEVMEGQERRTDRDASNAYLPTREEERLLQLCLGVDLDQSETQQIDSGGMEALSSLPDKDSTASILAMGAKLSGGHALLSVPSPTSTVSSESAGSSDFAETSAVGKTCVVCSADASGFRYYGAVVCNSCRAFFTRANKREAFQQFICTGGGLGLCQVESKSWRSCQKCRFDKCLAAGMNVGKTREARRRKVSASGSGSVAALTRQLDHTLTLSDCHAISVIVRSDQDFKLWQSGRFFTRDAATFACSMRMLFRGLPAPVELHRDLDRHSLFLLQRFYSSDGDTLISRLKSRDRSVMIKENFDLCMSLILALAIKCQRYVLDGDKVAALISPTVLSAIVDGDSDTVHAYRQIYLQESDEGRRPVAAFTFQRAFPKQLFAGNDKLEEKVRKMVASLNDWPKELLEDQSFPPLMVHLYLNSPDFLSLENPQQALDMQTQVTSLLYRYLKSKVGVRPGRAASLLGRILSSIAVAREVAAIRRHLIQARTINNY